MTANELLKELNMMDASGFNMATPIYTGVSGSRPVHSVKVVTNDDRVGIPGGQVEIWLTP